MHPLFNESPLCKLQARTWYDERGPYGNRYIVQLKAMNGHNDYTPPADHIVDLWQDNDVSRMLLHLVVLWKEGGRGMKVSDSTKSGN